MNNKAKIRNFLSKFVRIDSLGDRDDIFSSGLVNSLFAMQFILFVEKEFDITVDDEDLDLVNFNTIMNVDDFVARKQCAA